MSDSYTCCPGCDCRILPGQAVVGVSVDDGSEFGENELWHIGCRKTWEARRHAEHAADIKSIELFEDIQDQKR